MHTYSNIYICTYVHICTFVGLVLCVSTQNLYMKILMYNIFTHLRVYMYTCTPTTAEKNHVSHMDRFSCPKDPLE